MEHTSEPEVHRPNRELPESKMTKAVVILLLLVSAAVIAIVTAGSWTQLEGGQFIQIVYILMYVGIAVLVGRWNRGTLPVAAALAIVLFIVAAVAAPAWFTRDKPGISEPPIPDDMLGLLTLIILPLQVLLIVFSIRGFNQQWNVEEGPGADPSKLAR